MAYSIEDQVIALAGVFQAAALVNQVAKQGNAAESAYEASIKSLLMVDAPTTEAIFGDRLGIQLGLRELVKALGRGQGNAQPEIIRYTLSLLHLESKLRKHPEMLEIIGKRINQAIDQTRHFETTHSNVIKNLAGTYLDTISTFSVRIQVQGDPKHLQAQENADRIRALLLAGIRAAILWRQTGGRRYHLLFNRRKIVECAQRLCQ